MSIEAVCDTYRDVPRTICIKTEALRVGVKYSQAAKDALQGVSTAIKGYALFSQDAGPAALTTERIPYYYCLKSDDAIIITRINASSPYTIDWVDGRFLFVDETGEVADEIYYPPAPGWWDKTLKDGTPVRTILYNLGKDKAGVCFDHYCEHWQKKEQCQFCDIVAYLRTREAGGDAKEKVVTRHTPESVAEAMAIAFAEPGMRHMSLSSGAVLTKRYGKGETEWFLSFLHAISAALKGEMWSGYLQTSPAKSKEEIKRFYDAGITSLHMNMEVWDERLFNIMCPGKARVVGRDNWIAGMIDAVDVFGKGRILTNFVAGVEMSRPDGFTDAKTAVKSTLEGFDYLMSHDVLPKLNWWVAEAEAVLGTQPPPPTEYYMELQRGYTELRHKYGFRLPFPGYCRGCTGVDTAGEWDLYFA